MKYVLYILFFGSLICAGIHGKKLCDIMVEQNELRYDYSEINKLKYGLFNIDIWKGKVFNILEASIDDFEITSDDLTVIREQLEYYLNDLYVEYFESGKIIDALVESQADDGKENKLGKLFVGLFRKNIEKQIKEIDFKSQIPLITDQLMIEIERKIPEIKEAISSSISDLLAEELAQSMTDGRAHFYSKYEAKDAPETNQIILDKLENLKPEVDKTLRFCLFLLALGLLLILIGSRFIEFKHLMAGLTFSCIAFLALGLSLPMIELDARLSSVDLELLGQEIHFDEQVMFFQSKSIIDVTQTLLEGRTFDLKLVGILILLFSIVFPFLKMVLTIVYMYLEKAKQSKLIQIVIFYLGKWSMADVFVVAIFMSYIGFYGLINSMLGDFSNQSVSSGIDTLNYSKLSPGIIFFTLYCIFSILMSTIIHKRVKFGDTE